MTSTPPRLSLDGILDFISRSRRSLAPVFEAVSNALEAIAERQQTVAERGQITLRLYYAGLLDEEQTLERIEIEDNGVGFDQPNYERFGTFLDRSKGYNNRGSGRVQFLHFAERIEVTSTFEEAGKAYTRHFFCSPKTYITEPSVAAAPPSTPIRTTVAMSGFMLGKDAKALFDSLSLTELRNAIKSHFLLRLYLAKAANSQLATSFRFELFKKGRLADSMALTPDDIPTPETGDIKVHYVKLKNTKADAVEWITQPLHTEQLHWAHFKLSADEIAENGVVLCSKETEVDRLRVEGLKKSEAVDGHRFLTAIHGSVLDKPGNVSHTVDRFTFPTRSDTERAAREDLFFEPEREFLFLDDIEQAIEDALPGIYSDLYARKEELSKDVEAIARAHGIPLEVARSTKISFSDTEEQITEKIFKRQAESLAQQSIKIKKLFDELETLNPTDADYQAELEQRTSELLGLIPEQNKQELSRYIIRREMVAKVLGMIVNEKLAPPPASRKGAKGKKLRLDREGFIHDLLIKRKTGTASGPNDLWVLNEEFVHFEGFSDLLIDQIRDGKGNKILRPISKEVLDTYRIKPSRRPDIFLFAEEAQCILIELKAPDVDLSDYLGQLERYCNLIANFSVAPITRFYCYLIGENFSPMDIAGNYRKNVHGDWVRRTDYKIMRYEDGRQDEEIGEAHMEIIKLSAIHTRALRRNKSFADRLGISDAALEPKR